MYLYQSSGGLRPPSSVRPIADQARDRHHSRGRLPRRRQAQAPGGDRSGLPILRASGLAGRPAGASPGGRGGRSPSGSAGRDRAPRRSPL